MAEGRLYALGTQLDIQQILLEAQHRWLRPAEICEILQNYKNFLIAPEPSDRPPSGSLFLFDRKVLRYFRKDGHNWRKKKDGKTVKEAHERLKAGRIDVLHCYYAHGEDNENFQRRSYWLLEEELSNIVLVHYREVKGNRTNFNRIKETREATPSSVQTDDTIQNSEADSSTVSSKFHSYNYQVNSQTNNATSPNSTQASEYEDVESANDLQPSFSFRSFLDVQPSSGGRNEDAFAAPYYPQPFSNSCEGKFEEITQMNFVPVSRGGIDEQNCDGGNHFPAWGNDLENYTSPYQPSLSSILTGDVKEILGQTSSDALGIHSHGQGEWQASEGIVQRMSKFPNDPWLHIDPTCNLTPRFHEGQVSSTKLDIREDTQPSEQNLHHSNMEDVETNLTMEAKSNYSASKMPILGGFIKEGLKKLDSFDHWMSKELGDVNESQMQSSSGTYWDAVESEDGVDDSSISRHEQLDTFMLSPSLSQDQLFSIIDFSPNWAYSESEIKVLIMGKFLKSQQDVEKCKWACMFGEVEVPAEIVSHGVLRCYTPEHKAGRVPFYITCSNRLACSEVRDFDFKINNDAQDVSLTDTAILLHMRFGKFLSLGSSTFLPTDSNLSHKISSLLNEDENEWDQMMILTNEDMFSAEKVRDQLLQKLLKEKLYAWLLHKAAEGGKGPSVLDEGGQGVLHFAAALGYDWAIPPTIAAGVSINFRDTNGWTALHWAASCGRERTVGFLISLDALPGLLTDPTPTYPLGQTPADLASINGHKGIAGYLAESSIHIHLSSLTLKDKTNGAVAINSIKERTPTPPSDEDYPQELSMKDSLAAICGATQAAAQIHQVFRVQSFQKKQIKEFGDSEFGLSDERALSLIALKTNNKGGGYRDETATAAAVHIQNKFRSWKGRKDFLIMRQRIVKIQAHVRGHQVRKNYKKIVWSVGILDKVILRWRRKGSGLRGFKPETLPENHSNMKQEVTSSLPSAKKDDEYDFLKEGRKQAEQRLQKALARVKSMVQYPEARDQYRRLLNVITEIQRTKAMKVKALNHSNEAVDIDEDLVDLETFLRDDTVMSTTPSQS